MIELLKSWGYGRFAVVMKVTRRLRSAHPLVALFYRGVNKLPIAKSLLLGTTWTLEVKTHFDVADYPFIVAIPQWLAARSPE